MFPPYLQRLCVAAACCLTCILVTQGLRAKPHVPRALWVWGEADSALPAWAAARGIDTLLFEIPTSRFNALSTREVIGSAQKQGQQVWALSGHAHWARSPRSAKRWVRAVAQQEGIAGVVLDVEPYLLDEWDTDRNRVERAYLRMLKLARRASSDLPLMAAVPFWFDHDTYRNASGTLAERVAARVDALVVMAYRDELSVGDGIVALARGEIEVAARLDKVAMVALQTAADDLDKLTFFEEDRDALGRAVMAIEGTPGFGGVALHHYRAYRELRGGSEDS